MEDHLQKVRERLVDQLRLLSEDVETGLDSLSAQEDRHHIADLEDLAGDTSADAVVFEQFRTSGATLEQIQRAIHRIDDGTYTTCEECEGPIGDARLEAIPFATHCIECKKRLESSAP